jgi:hypothetical protein
MQIGSISTDKTVGGTIQHSCPSGADVEEYFWSFTATPLYAITSWCIGTGDWNVSYSFILSPFLFRPFLFPRSCAIAPTTKVRTAWKWRGKTLKKWKVIPSLVLLLRDANTRASRPEAFLLCSSRYWYSPPPGGLKSINCFISFHSLCVVNDSAIFWQAFTEEQSLPEDIGLSQQKVKLILHFWKSPSIFILTY